jgi:hypothetical protein
MGFMEVERGAKYSELCESRGKNQESRKRAPSSDFHGFELLIVLALVGVSPLLVLSPTSIGMP